MVKKSTRTRILLAVLAFSLVLAAFTRFIYVGAPPVRTAVVQSDDLIVMPGDDDPEEREALQQLQDEILTPEGQHDYNEDNTVEEEMNRLLMEENSEEIDGSSELSSLSEALHNISIKPITGPRKIVEFAYMRGGSSLFGQVFNHFQHSIYWYEPLDSFYTHYAAMHHWTIPFDITFDEHGSSRTQDVEEQDAVGIFLSDLLNCRIDNLPSEILSVSGDTVGKMKWYEGYHNCLKSKKAGEAHRCTDTLAKGPCSNQKLQVFENHCPEWIKAVSDGVDKITVRTADGDSEEISSTADILQKFKDRKKCIHDMRNKVNKCTATLKAACDNSNIRSAKILRTRMTSMEDVLRYDPTILVLHVVRDPRGTMMSRQKIALLSKNLGKSMSKEGVVLCRQMLEDIQERKRLEKLYPRTFIQIRYEDLATDLEATLRRLYTYLDMEYDAHITEQMKTMMFAGKSGSGFSQLRGNATLVASAWRGKIKPELKSIMDSKCGELYTELGYEV